VRKRTQEKLGKIAIGWVERSKKRAEGPGKKVKLVGITQIGLP